MYLIILIIFLIAVPFPRFAGGDKGPCARFAYGCCAHTQWDPEKEACVDCQIGYYWYNCSRKCPFPRFGLRCKQVCSCPEEMCDYMTGCIIDTNGDQGPRNSNFITTKRILLMCGTSLLGVVLIAYITIWIIDKRRKKILSQYTNEHI